MIISIGIDIIEKKRIKKYTIEKNKNLIKKILNQEEKKKYNNVKKKIEFISKIFTIKEALSKAFCIGLKKNLTFKNIKIKSTKIGKPLIKTKKKIYITLSHEKNITISLVIIIKN